MSDKKHIKKLKEEGPNRFQRFKADIDEKLGDRVSDGKMSPYTATAISTLTDFFVPDDAADLAATMVPGGKILTKGRKLGKALKKGKKAEKAEPPTLDYGKMKEDMKKARKKGEDEARTIKYAQKEKGGQDLLKDPEVIEKPKMRTTEEFWEEMKKKKPEK